MGKSIFCLFKAILVTHTNGMEDNTGEGLSDGEDVCLTLPEGAPDGFTDGNTEVDGALLENALIDGAFVLVNTIATGSAVVIFNESNDPMMIANIATMTNIRQRRNLILCCFHQGRGGLIGSPMQTSSFDSSTKTASGTLKVESRSRSGLANVSSGLPF